LLRGRDYRLDSFNGNFEALLLNAYLPKPEEATIVMSPIVALKNPLIINLLEALLPSRQTQMAIVVSCKMALVVEQVAAEI